MNNFNKRIVGLSPEKRTLLEQLLLKNPSLQMRQQEICRTGTTEPCSLSFAQEKRPRLTNSFIYLFGSTL